MPVIPTDSESIRQMAPRCHIEVNGKKMSIDLVGLIRSVEYESTDNMADMAKIVFSNPNFVISNVKALQPGNEISLWFGYGNNIKHVGRVIIVRHNPTYPRSGMPIIEVIGYTADRRMMDHSPPEPKKKKRSRNKASGLSHNGKTYADVIREKAEAYEFKFSDSVDNTEGQPKRFFQKFGMSDYDFIRGMANITGYFFWVDGDKDGNWTLHFKKPESRDYVQEKRYDFRYNAGDYSTLLEFRPELLIHGQRTSVKAQYVDPDTGKLVVVEFPEQTSKPSPDVLSEPYETDVERAKDRELFGENHTSGTAVKLFINDYSFEAMAPRRIQDAKELRSWAEQWYRGQQENFVMAEGAIVGLETFMARQIHNISGVKGGMEGLYYFHRVRHRIDSNGYECDFNARKIIE